MPQRSSTFREIWITTTLLFVLGVFSYNAPGQQTSDPPMRILYPCQLKLKASGAEFSYTYSYWVTADESGRTTKVTPFKSDMRATMSRFVYEDAFIACVKKWTLEPNGKYIVQFRVATMFLGETSEPHNYVLILGPGESKQKLKMELLWSAEDTLDTQIEKPGQEKSKSKP
ncbi:MAG TPA: hypothetical protein DEP46_06130 [Blastocatellia bacterium]|nr:hypothetical protein [Blastocatellia bacterium]